MKKFIILFLSIMVLSIGMVEARPYSERSSKEPKFDVSLYGGYNFAGRAPVFGGLLGVEILFLRADLDVGSTCVNLPNRREFFPTITPSLGFVIGDKHKLYLMGGIQNYSYTSNTTVNECKENKFHYDLIRFKARIGYQCTIWKQLFINAETGYMFSSKHKDDANFVHSNIQVGIGWKF